MRIDFVKKQGKHPPKIARRLLSGLSVYEEYFSITADFDGEFYERLSDKGIVCAHAWYWSQTLLALIYYLYLTMYWSAAMFKNYVKIAFRNSKRHKVFSFINVTGLAMGIASTILIMLWVQDELSYDTFHENADNMYIATFSNGSTTTPTALAGFLKTEYPEVVSTSRFIPMGSVLIEYRDNKFVEQDGIMVDPGFLQMFTLKFLKGNPESALIDPHSIVISESFAARWFGAEEPVGNILTINNNFQLTVTGIFRDYPRNSHIQFSYIMPIKLSEEWWNNNLDTWKRNNITTYVQLQDKIDSHSVDVKIARIVQQYKSQEQRTLSLWPVPKIYLYDYGGGGRILFIYVFSMMAFFILLIACINFMNLSTARASTRAREVGMRKAVGALRSDLVIQFFGESVFLTLVSLSAGIAFAVLFLPVMNSLTGKQFTPGVLVQLSSLMGIIGITLTAGILSGSYPALLLSRFHPAAVLHSKCMAGKKQSGFRSVLVVIQFSLSIILIIGTLFFYKQLNYLRNANLGFQSENVLYMNIGSRISRNIDTIKERLLSNPGILSVTTTNAAPYQWESNAGLGDVHWEGQGDRQIRMVLTTVDYDYLETFDIPLMQGRFFSEEYTTDVLAILKYGGNLNKKAMLEHIIKKKVVQTY